MTSHRSLYAGGSDDECSRIVGLADSTDVSLNQLTDYGTQQVLDIQRAALATANDLSTVEHLAPEVNQAYLTARRMMDAAIESSHAQISIEELRDAARAVLLRDIPPMLRDMEFEQSEN